MLKANIRINTKASQQNIQTSSTLIKFLKICLINGLNLHHLIIKESPNSYTFYKLKYTNKLWSKLCFQTRLLCKATTG